MVDKLISSGVFGLVFVVVLNAMYRNRKFLEDNYVNKFNKTTKIIIYIISLVATMIILVSIHNTDVPAVLTILEDVIVTSLLAPTTTV